MGQDLAGWDAISDALLGADAGVRQAAIVALRRPEGLPAGDVGRAVEALVPLLTGDDPGRSTTATRALQALVPRAVPAFDAVQAALAAVPADNDYLQRRLKWVLAGLGVAAEERLTAMIDKDPPEGPSLGDGQGLQLRQEPVRDGQGGSHDIVMPPCPNKQASRCHAGIDSIQGWMGCLYTGGQRMHADR